MLFALPIVRTRRLPAAADALHWRETGDFPAAIAVFVVAVVGGLLGGIAIVHLANAADGMNHALLIAALVVLLPCAFALIAALVEFTRVHTVSIENGTVYRSIHQLGRKYENAESLHQYQGLLILDRTRRLFIRNQDRPLTGRRGPVTEFVIVLRHAQSRALDVELFRAQPALQTLLAMHRLQNVAGGRAGATNANACVELAASYRQALTRLCQQLHKPVLIPGADNAMHEWPVNTLDEWLQPPS